MIKILTVADWDEIRTEVCKLDSHQVAQTKHTVTEHEYLDYTYKTLSQPSNTMYGFYKDGILSSYICATKIKMNPEYVVTNWKNLKPSSIFNPMENGWGDLWTAMVTDMEADNRYSFLLVKTTDVKRLQFKRVQRMYEQASPKLTNYIRTVEEVVPAGQYSKYEYFKRALYYDKKYDYETLVFRFTCKQEFRINLPSELQESVTY